ncbi:MAG: imidazole glycerol phosphate synthase subunit HisH [Bacteroidia bacterium]|nr:MAG: imidazole glycerol phosphate synthase subunit HisH [Bacteroidia bacterium]
MTQRIKIAHYNAGNIASVMNALGRLGVRGELATSPEDIKTADKLIFPGVGHAKPAMELLRSKGMDQAIKDFQGPVLGICLGMQLMAESSEEGNMQGMSIFPESIKLFTGRSKIPHMGWNSLHALKGPLFDKIDEGCYVYFVHSYYMPSSELSIAGCDYEGRFTAAIARDNFFGVQFHPEKSGETGMTILKNFIKL